MGFNKEKIMAKIRLTAQKELEQWIDSEGVPLCQEIMRYQRYDTGRLASSIHQEGSHIIVGGQRESPTARDDGRGDKFVDYAMAVEARFSPVRGHIIPALEQLNECIDNSVNVRDTGFVQ